MFTGLVEEIGEVASLQKGSLSLKIKVNCKEVLTGAKIGDSIATNGACLTVVELGNNYFIADCMNETMKRTTFNFLKVGERVNLEKSITLSTPLGGHLVTGDIDCIGKIVNLKKDGIATIYEVEIPERYMKYVVEKGRITLDGASLTVSDLTNNTLFVSLIPHSQDNLTLGRKKVGDILNIETDLIGKYVEKMLFSKNDNKTSSEKKEITKEFLLENGF